MAWVARALFELVDVYMLVQDRRFRLFDRVIFEGPSRTRFAVLPLAFGSGPPPAAAKALESCPESLLTISAIFSGN